MFRALLICVSPGITARRAAEWPSWIHGSPFPLLCFSAVICFSALFTMPCFGLSFRFLSIPFHSTILDNKKVVVSNETSAQVGHDLLWRLEDEFNEFPKTMGWFKKVNLDAPTNAAATARPRHRDRVGAARGGIGESCGSSGGAAAEPELDLRDPCVRLSVPAYSSEGNILEVETVRHYVCVAVYVLCVLVSFHISAQFGPVMLR